MTNKLLMSTLSALCGAYVANAADPLVVDAGGEMTLSTSATYSTITVNGRLTIDAAAVITADAVYAGWNGGTGTVAIVDGAKLVAATIDLGSCTEGAANPVAGCGTLSLDGGATVEAKVYLSRNCADAGATIVSSPTNTVVLGAGTLLKGTVGKFGDPMARLAFAGGTLMSGANMSLVSFRGLGDLFIDSVDGAPIRLNCGNVHSTFPNIPTGVTTGRVRFRGTGDLIREGAPTSVDTPLHMAGYNIYQDDWSGFTGRIVVQDGGIRWFRGGQADQTDGMRAWCATNGGFIYVGPGRQTIGSFASADDGYISTKETTPVTLVVNVTNAQAWAVQSELVNIRKMKVGELTLSSETHGDLTVGGGAVRLANVPTQAWKYYRFKVDKLNSVNTPYSSDKYVQISELKLYNGAQNVTGKRAGFLSGDTRTSGEYAGAALDGKVDTKWCFNSTADNYWITIEYAQPQKVTRYEWYTANDAIYDNKTKSWREPMDWRFQGSMDGTNWQDLDSQKDFVATAARKTLAYTGNCAAVTPTVAVTDTVRALVSTGATLRLGPGRDLYPKRLHNYGTIAYETGATIRCGTDGADAEVVNPQFGGTGDIVKTGAGVTTLLGVNATTGKVKVEQGTLRLGGAGTSDKYWRFTAMNVVFGLDRLFQLGELELRALDGTYVNRGITEVGVVEDATRLQPRTGAFVKDHGYVTSGNESLTKLFDGDWTTKCCAPKLAKDATGNNQPDRTKPATWIQFVFRLADDAKPVAWYQLVSGNDAVGQRNPDDWRIESSVDGVTWTTHDEREQQTVPMANSAIFNDGIVYALTNCSGTVCAPVPNASEVSIAPGAELALVPFGTTLNTLTIDCMAGAGTLRGFSAAENGTLRLVNTPSKEVALKMVSLPITLVDIGNTRNLRTWRVFVNGAETVFHPMIKNGRLVLGAPGLTVIVR